MYNAHLHPGRCGDVMHPSPGVCVAQFIRLKLVVYTIVLRLLLILYMWMQNNRLAVWLLPLLNIYGKFLYFFILQHVIQKRNYYYVSFQFFSKILSPYSLYTLSKCKQEVLANAG